MSTRHPSARSAVEKAAEIGRHQSEIIGTELFEREFAAPLARALAGEASNFRVTVDFQVGPAKCVAMRWPPSSYSLASGARKTQ